MESVYKNPQDINYENYGRYKESPTIPDTLYKKVAEMLRSAPGSTNHCILFKCESDPTFFVMHYEANCPDFSDGNCESIVEAFKRNSWESFKEYTDMTKTYKVLRCAEVGVKCTCYIFSRSHYCKHSIYTQYTLNHPETFTKVRMHMRLARTKKAMGRTAQSKRALQRQVPVPLRATSTVPLTAPNSVECDEVGSGSGDDDDGDDGDDDVPVSELVARKRAREADVAEIETIVTASLIAERDEVPRSRVIVRPRRFT